MYTKKNRKNENGIGKKIVSHSKLKHFSEVMVNVKDLYKYEYKNGVDKSEGSYMGPKSRTLQLLKSS